MLRAPQRNFASDSNSSSPSANCTASPSAAPPSGGRPATNAGVGLASFPVYVADHLRTDLGADAGAKIVTEEQRSPIPTLKPPAQISGANWQGFPPVPGRSSARRMYQNQFQQPYYSGRRSFRCSPGLEAVIRIAVVLLAADTDPFHSVLFAKGPAWWGS